ncbi:MAG TPA: ATP-binding cassette domain-containing protein [Tepidisphaeraceae bacterium]|jgi:iron complex transport system ATP-binding protein
MLGGEATSDTAGEQPAFALAGVGVLRNERWILKEVSWRVPTRTCCAILGPNGSGKSTLTRILAAHLYPTAGEVEVLGHAFGETDLPALRHQIRLVQAAGPYDVDPSLTAREAVLTGFFGTLGLYDAVTIGMTEQADDLLRRVGLSKIADQRYEVLSSGERVRTLIARALASEPKLLLLDEPTAGLDLLAREQVLATVQGLFDNPKHDLTAVMITHHLEELPPATSAVLLLDDGKVAAAGTPAQVLQAESLSKVYRCTLHVEERGGRYSVHVDPGEWRDLLEK